ncbi:GTP-binding protein [Aurantibacter crassamenti]|uniref:GTP-binding protein n=1 Tax=Aurantibacter crassamenti TaxID=1837375 RepID=UPI0019395A68|nr:GTP-binding protein [Aurantibacter crassamenti]MBM1107357.1 GTP-binding protein [Aurantibacter crassamenti]
MKPLSNDIVLRPRFQIEVPETKESVLNSFEKDESSSFIIKRLDEHVFIKFTPKQNNFWSPQLHLEIDTLNDKNCKIYGVFGPNPALWTFFMFLHFGIAILFIIMSVWAYSNAALQKSYTLQLFFMGLMVVIWFALYLFGRAGKHKGKPQMHELYNFVLRKLSNTI